MIKKTFEGLAHTSNGAGTRQIFALNEFMVQERYINR